MIDRNDSICPYELMENVETKDLTPQKLDLKVKKLEWSIRNDIKYWFYNAKGVDGENEEIGWRHWNQPATHDESSQNCGRVDKAGHARTLFPHGGVEDQRGTILYISHKLD